MTDATKRAPTVYIGNNTWQVEEFEGPSGPGIFVTIGPPVGHVMAEINPHGHTSNEAANEIAALIAAAPDLMEAAIQAVDALTPARNGEERDAKHALVRAVHKAKGNDNA